MKPDQAQPQFDPPLEQGIRRYVEILCCADIETYESCEGGSGHAYPEPTIRFHGEYSEGFRALSLALQHDLPVKDLRRVWDVIDGEPTGPTWEIVFFKAPVPGSASPPATMCKPLDSVQ